MFSVKYRSSLSFGRSWDRQSLSKCQKILLCSFLIYSFVYMFFVEDDNFCNETTELNFTSSSGFLNPFETISFGILIMALTEKKA